MSIDLNFKPRARLLLQLGDQLIRNESIALVELVKNAYDADASRVKIEIKNSEDIENGIITIEDDGHGMDINIVESVWLEPGSDYKEKLFKIKQLSQKYKRLPLGEKGIGRFGVHKLGKKVEIISKMDGKNEVFFSIDWSQFHTSDYLAKVPISITERKPIFFKNSTGTLIRILGLNSVLDESKVRDIYRNILVLNSPFNKIDTFRVDFIIDKPKWIEDLMTFEKIKDLSLFNADITIENSYITEFFYNFTAHAKLTKADRRSFQFSDPKLMVVEKKNKKSSKEEENEIIDLSLYKIGKIQIEILIFDKGTSILNHILGREKNSFKEYLNANGGVKVFRDGIRVYDYGDPGNDWLELDSKRINAPGEKISNNIIIGSVNIKRADSEDLIEKTNREGFIETAAFVAFKKAIQFALRQVEIQRNADKAILREMYDTINVKEPVKDSLRKLKEKIDAKIKDEPLKKDLLSKIKQIDKEYQYLTDIYIHSGGSNNNLRIGLHEIEKIIGVLNHEILKENMINEKVKELAQYLKEMVGKYFEMNLVEKPHKEKVSNIIKTSIKYLSYRINAHGIEVLNDFSGCNVNVEIDCVKNLVISSIINIFDNSFYWLAHDKIKVKKIYISITQDYYPDTISIIIADNGKGIRLPKEAITKPFITGKEEGGMGMGLNIVAEIMKMHSGFLDFPDCNEFNNIPSEFNNGAIVMLTFKLGEMR